jgi:hypothetical protein
MRVSPGVMAGVAFLAIFVGTVALMMVVFYEEVTSNNRGVLEWWQRTVIYHVYVPSFYDTDADGIGDIQGQSLNSLRQNR